MSLSKYNKTTKELEPIAGGFDVQGILDDIGDLTDLDTSTKTDLVSAVNEVKGDIPTKTSDLTNNSGFVGLGETSSTAYAGDKGKANTSAIEAIVNEYGAKNLLPFFAISTVLEGVTWTVDNTKKIITVNGTAANWSFQEGHSYPITLKAGQKYILSSGVDNSNQYNVFIEMYDAVTIASLGQTINGDIEYTPQADQTVYYNVVVRSGATVSNVEMKPMIRDARITDPTYVPYAMPNSELTDLLLSQTKFIGTLDGDVLTRAKSMPNERVYFYGNSNAPTNAPSGCEWGSYIMYKSGNNTSILYLDNAHIASAYGINDNSTSITWHIV